MSAKSEQTLFDKLQDSDYRKAFIASTIRAAVPLHFRYLRKSRRLTQSQVEKTSGKAQSWISQLENSSYGKMTVQTLLDLAAVYDVALLIKPVPFSRFLREYDDFSDSALEVESFQEEYPIVEMQALHGVPSANTADADIIPGGEGHTPGPTSFGEAQDTDVHGKLKMAGVS